MRTQEEGLIPNMALKILLVETILPRHLAKKMERMGEIKSPFLSPLEGLKKAEGEQLTRIAKEVVVTN